MPILPLSNVISVTVISTPTGLALPNINTVALFSSESPIVSIPTGYKVYQSATDVGTDWGTSSKAYHAAVAFFGQQPNPLQTQGYLVIFQLQSAGAEKVEAAIARTINTVFYFGVLVDQTLGASDLSNLTTYIQTLDKMLIYGSAVKADYAPGGLLDLFRTSSLTHSRGIFYNNGSNQEKFLAAGYASRGFSTDFSGSRTCQTMHLKAIAGFDADPTIDATEELAAKTAGVDVNVNEAGDTCLFTSGANGSFFDEIYNEFWFKFALQVAGFNYLKKTNTKIPQTEEAMSGWKAQYAQVCEQAVRNGYLAKGLTWTGDSFGNPADLQRNVADHGYYIYSVPVSQQSASNRAARNAPLVQIAANTAGAFHGGNVVVNVI